MNKLKTRLEKVRHRPQPPVSESHPRAVCLSASGWVLAILSFMLLAAAVPVGAWMFVVAEKDQLERDSLTGDSAIAQAEVTELTRTRGENAKYYARYRFAAGDGEYQGRSTLQRGRWQKLKIGSTLEVVYRKSNPAQYWVRGREPKGMPFWAGPVTGLLLALGGIGLVATIRCQWSLLSDGRAVTGRVTHTKKDQHGHIVHYSFRLLSGSMKTGRYGPVSAAPGVGDSVYIIYDPENPGHTSKLPLALVEQQRRL